MTTGHTDQPQLDIRPFQIFAPVPPMLAEACGYAGQVFGHKLDARFVGFYFERCGDETMYDDGQNSGTGEFAGFRAYVEHPRVAVHLRHYDWGSSETLPCHMLVLDRADHRLYGMPVKLAQTFLLQQWPRELTQISEMEGVLHIDSLADLPAALDINAWQEVKLPDDFHTQVLAAMRRERRIVSDLVAWLNKQQPAVTPGRIAEYEPNAQAMLLSHVVETGPGGFAQAGELVHIHEVNKHDGQVTITFSRDNGTLGPDEGHLFTLSGTWVTLLEHLEVLLETSTLDDLLDSHTSLEQMIGRYTAWHGHPFPIVALQDSLAIRVTLPCCKCGANPMTAFARSGLDKGVFCDVYDDAAGTLLADLRNQEYVCKHCRARAKKHA